MAKNVIIYDKYLSDCSKYFKKSSASIESITENYNKILEYLLKSGLTKGETHQSLMDYYTNSLRLNNKISIIGDSLQNEINTYLNNVEILDSNIY